MIPRLRLVLLLPSLLITVAPLLPQSRPPAPDSQYAIPSIATVPPEAQPSASFNIEAATDAWLAKIPAAARVRSDAYFEGGYWLVLWDFLIGVAISILLLHTGWSAALRDLAERIVRVRWIQTFLYVSAYAVVTAILGFPMAIYEGYFREHQYGLATQTLGPWMNDQLKGLLLAILLGGLFAIPLFAIVRRLRRTWWLWGSLATLLFTLLATMIAPVYLVPVFNKVTRLDDPKVTAPILRMARANGIPAKDVYQIDASRQTTRMSANVSGFGSTMRITLNDNLLRRGSPEEILAIVGHEMGHYVLNHVYNNFLFLGIVIVVGFAWLRWSLAWTLARWGGRWRIRDIGDPAVVPLVVLLASAFFFVLLPIQNTQTRAEEYEADMYGLNASRQPDGFAQAALHLSEYRKMKPGPLEEWIFFDHPSGYNRIYAAMRWKAENLDLSGAPATPPGK